MSYAQLTRDEIRVLQLVHRGLIYPPVSAAHDANILRSLNAALLIETENDTVRLTKQGRDWLAVYGVK